MEGLYAVGEVAAGLHGANRLGGNSLSETDVFGRRAGVAAATFSRSLEVQLRSSKAVDDVQDDLDSLVHDGNEIVRPAQRALRDAMWECGGVVRSEEGLSRGLAKVADIHDELGSIEVRPTAEGYGDLAHVLDLRAALVVTEGAARERCETRGCHNRSDYPQLDRDLQVNFQLRLVDEAVELSRAEVRRVPEDLRAWATDREELADDCSSRRASSTWSPATTSRRCKLPRSRVGTVTISSPRRRGFYASHPYGGVRWTGAGP